MANRRGREDDPIAVGRVLDQLISRRGWAEHMRLGRLQEAWADIVGEHVAARSEPVKLDAGVLHVRADGSAWATELTLLSRSIASKAAAFLGDETVQEVRVSAAVTPATERGRNTRHSG